MAERKNNIKKLFQKCDASKDGSLSKEELMTLMKILTRTEITADDIADYFFSTDKNKDGKITFDEFCVLFEKRDTKCLSEEELKAEFKKCDHDNSGFIEADELENLLHQAKGWDADRIARDMKKIDKSGDGKISISEFLALF